MNLLFDPVNLGGNSMYWTHKTITYDHFPGYYHWHQCCEMLFVHEGHGNVIVNQNTYGIRPGMLYFFQPFQLHKVFAEVGPDTPYARTIMHFDSQRMLQELARFSRRQRLFRDLVLGNPGRQAFDLSGEIKFVERALLDLKQQDANDGQAPQEEINLMLLQVMGILLPYADKLPSESRPLRYSEAIMQWIETHYADEISLDLLAEELHLSKYYVSRVFREETGSNLTDYLIARRIKQACRLLHTTDLPIEKIGGDVGIPNTSYFIQVFKKVVGTTPLKYRKEG